MKRKRKVYNTRARRWEHSLETMLTYRKKGLSYREIGELLGCSESNVQQRLAKVESNLGVIKEYREARSDLLADKERQLLAGITPEKIGEAGVRDLAVATGILYDKGRLEDGKSTQNIAYADILRQNISLRNELKKLDEEYGNS